jgi:hypothetical protein
MQVQQGSEHSVKPGRQQRSFSIHPVCTPYNTRDHKKLYTCKDKPRTTRRYLSAAVDPIRAQSMATVFRVETSCPTHRSGEIPAHSIAAIEEAQVRTDIDDRVSERCRESVGTCRRKGAKTQEPQEHPALSYAEGRGRGEGVPNHGSNERKAAR